MKLEIEVLDGPQKGKRISLKNGRQIGLNEPFAFSDEQIAMAHAVLTYDSGKPWVIECLAPLKLRLGNEEVARATLLPGLIFHIGQTGFKVVEKEKLTYSTWEEGLKDWLSHSSAQAITTDFFFFPMPVRLTFIQGGQFEEYYTLSYGPRLLGSNNLDLNLKDPFAPPRVAKFFQVGTQSYVENMCGDRVKINGQNFDQCPIQNGDRLSVGSDVIEMTLLK